jgi:hypothetical protein
MIKKKLFATVAALCAAGALTAGIAQGSASKTTSTPSTTTTTSATPGSGASQPPGRAGGPRGAMHDGAVHSVSVVLDKAGTAYITQTTDSGTLQSADSSAGTVTIVEGSKSVIYKTATIEVPAQATVTLDAKQSTLSALKAGDEVSVSSSSDGTTVWATDSSFKPQGGPGHGGPGGPPPSGEGASTSSGSAGSG